MDNVIEEIRVLIVTGKNDTYPRQLPGGEPYIERNGRRYHFFINERDCNPDIVVVRNKHFKTPMTFEIERENTILMMSEPKSVVSFPKRYLKQFGMVYSCQENVDHKNVVYGPALLPWTFDVVRKGSEESHHLTFDELISMPLPEKSKDLSIIISDKSHTKGHQARLDFVYKLKEHYGDRLDLFGRGFKEFDEKWALMSPYRYHIAIENSSSRYYWTEKLSDGFVCGCYPIYYGCKNTEDYFDKESYASIDIEDVEGAIRIIDDIVARNVYEEKKALIEKSKEQVLVKYDMFHIIADCCDKLKMGGKREKVTLMPCRTATDMRHIYNNLIERNLQRAKNIVKTAMGMRKFDK
ncbi:MAG: glycosyltransferase family 10 [Bacteroidales bacterium]|nr:glycosyltransferase family 10 [Bacteroidales bacterium]